MENGTWFLLIGLLMLGRGLTSTILTRSPFSSLIVYLVVGLIAGPNDDLFQYHYAIRRLWIKVLQAAIFTVKNIPSAY